MPTHRSVRVELNLPSCKQRINKMRRPRSKLLFDKIKDEDKEAEEAWKHVEPILRDYDTEWHHNMQWGNADWALQLLSQMSEEYLQSRRQGTRFVPPADRGRGEVRMQQHDNVAPTSVPGELPETARLTQIKKLLRRAEELQRKALLRPERFDHDPQVHDLQRTCHQLAHKLCPGWQMQPLGGCCKY